MPVPSDPKKLAYMFSDDMKFLQKAVIYHPSENKILTLKRSSTDMSRPNKWDLIGGNVKFGEKHDESLIREIKEETGLETEHLVPIQITTNFENGIYFLFIGYKTKALSQDVLLSNEHTEYRWVTLDEFLELDCGLEFDNFLHKLVTIIQKNSG